jgi:hypothetical protein
MAAYEIRSWHDNRLLYSGDFQSLRNAVEAAVRAGADLAGARLDEASLAGADLAGADLAGADLAGADLAGARLVGADLDGADLAGADLAGADLAGANFYGADLYGADLDNITGDISSSHELLAELAIQHDDSLTPVAAMIAGRRVGCWPRYTRAIREIFGEDVMRQLWRAWSQEVAWGVVKKMRQYGWPEPKNGD